MTMDILKIIKEVETRKFFLNTENNCHLADNLSELLISAHEEYVFYVGINDFVLDYYKQNPKTNWKIKAIFQLGNPFLFFYLNNCKNTEGLITRAILKDKQWSLFIFTKNDFESVIIGFDDFHRYSFEDEFKYDEEKSYKEYGNEEYIGRPVLDKNYNPTHYFELINLAIERNATPDFTEEEYEMHPFSFTIIPKESFFLKYLDYLSRYKKSVVEDFGLPTEKEKITSLKDIVQFVHQFSDKDNNISINENDIVTNGLFLNIDTNSVSKHISIANKNEMQKFKFVLRSFSLSPYYIWALLNSEFIQDYCLSNFEYYDDFEPVEMKNLPCFIPKTINNSYFQKKYEVVKQTKLTVHKKLENNETSSFFNNNAKEIILKDLTELRLCFKAKAYKATIIMAGSILEAFLIDWLSEIDGINYFNKKEERYGLAYYIDKIHNLKKSTWDDAAKKARTITKKRNLVHAKLYIDDSDISKETCTEVINYLEYVVKTRWK
jgi:hypothetical protein